MMLLSLGILRNKTVKLARCCNKRSKRKPIKKLIVMCHVWIISLKNTTLDRSRSGIWLSPSFKPQPRWAAAYLTGLFFNRLQYKNNITVDAHIDLSTQHSLDSQEQAKVSEIAKRCSLELQSVDKNYLRYSLNEILGDAQEKVKELKEKIKKLSASPAIKKYQEKNPAHDENIDYNRSVILSFVYVRNFLEAQKEEQFREMERTAKKRELDWRANQRTQQRGERSKSLQNDYQKKSDVVNPFK
jgi:hypothetical protein